MSSMENLLAIGLGLGLRVVVDYGSRHNVKLTGTLVGLWEGAVLHHFLDKTPLSWDPYVAFGFRVFVDLIVTTNLPRLAITLMWASLTMMLADLGTRKTWYEYLAKFVYRRYRRVRRAVKRLAVPAVRLPIPPIPLPKPPVPSRVRFYTITTTPSQTSSTPPVPIPPPGAVPVVTSPPRRHVPGQYTDTGSESSSVHNDLPTDTSTPGPSPPSADGPSQEETPVLRIFPSSMMTPPLENELVRLPGPDPDRTPTTSMSALPPVAGPSSIPPPIISPPNDWEIERPEPTPVDVPPIGDIPEIHPVEEPERRNAPPSRPASSIHPPAEPDREYVHVQMPPLHDIPDMERQRSESQPSLRVRAPEAKQVPELTPVPISNLRNIPDLPSTSEEELIKKPAPSNEYPDEKARERFPGERYPEDEENQPVASTSRLQTDLPHLPAPVRFNPDFDLFGEGWDNLGTPPPPFKERASYIETIPSQPSQPEQASYMESIPSQPSQRPERSPTHLTTATASPGPSPLSGGSRNSIIARADLLRDQALAEERERDRLRRERQEALDEGRPNLALLYKYQIEQADERIRKLHQKAARRYFLAHNQTPLPTRTIDVHRLRVPEAVRETEKAVREALVTDAREVRVITGRGNHSVNKMPVLKMALLKHLQSNHFPTRVDPSNPGVLIVDIPEEELPSDLPDFRNS
ncbi:hypothetical protein GLOTRDRAFT_137404 [Gloeophyllum trabeum ATCC 11539]|uniref:Smr domain-containing protein n=1 Tax=Gloeophyllum trabeum (strain ATCC 11539 / FP-39264 / Madison 617) TaxID=670483 RepID=S7QC54_GLOTA|nr:uncharacterized protein GLOTRDRAFT_137404 [Gloeophyllum trabeum ATCC 11539]EPQ56943.1 hypothetical protein GLOTRDRAFT_137404 [Gloeophyllum trabeum ATCC 11539]